MFDQKDDSGKAMIIFRKKIARFSRWKTENTMKERMQTEILPEIIE